MSADLVCLACRDALHRQCRGIPCECPTCTHQNRPQSERTLQTESQTFHVGDLLSVYTGYMVSPNMVGGVYRLVDFVTGQTHLTHQLPRASEEIKPELARQFPWLVGVTVPEFADEAEVWSWLAWQTSEHGEEHEVTPLPEGAYVGREPIAELREMAPHLRIVTVGGEAPYDLDGGPS